MDITLYQLGMRFLGLLEIEGEKHNPQVLAMLQSVDRSTQNDETPWCSAFVNYLCWLMDIPHSKSLAARSWLVMGKPIEMRDAMKGYDIVILSRGDNPAPATELHAPGHVALYSSQTPGTVSLLGGNQGNKVSIAAFSKTRVLGVRRLWGS